MPSPLVPDPALSAAAACGSPPSSCGHSPSVSARQERLSAKKVHTTQLIRSPFPPYNRLRSLPRPRERRSFAGSASRRSVLRISVMFDRLKRLFSASAREARLQEHLERLRREIPVPILWLFGKTQSGKTSIVKYLTGAESAEIGKGFQPCTRFSQQYQFPLREAPLADLPRHARAR